MHRVHIWIYCGFMELEERLFGKKFLTLRQLRPERGDYIGKFKNHAQLPYSFIHYHYLVRFLFISRSTELIFDFLEIFLVRGEFIWEKLSALDSDTSWDRRTPYTILKIAHNYWIFYFITIFGSLSHHFKVHIVDIWLYWVFCGVKGEVLR